jgi:hypothetical protein
VTVLAGDVESGLRRREWPLPPRETVTDIEIQDFVTKSVATWADRYSAATGCAFSQGPTSRKVLW